MGNFYIVSQNKSYKQERELGLLFAPSDRPLPHWRSMEALTPEDVVFCAFRQRIVSVAVPRSYARVDDRPAGLPPAPWAATGWVCDVEYHDLPQPIAIYTELDLAWRLGEARFDKTGEVTQQYLVQLSDAFAGYLTATFGGRLPASIVHTQPSSGVVASSSGGGGFTPITTEIDNATKSTTERKPVSTTIAVSLAHGSLVTDYADHVEARHGHRPLARAYPTPVTSSPLRADVVDDVRGLLIEAKPVLTVDDLYRALGQLAIYGQLEASPREPAVLVGAKPRKWYLDRLEEAGVSCVWRTTDGFRDNAKGRFT